MRLDEKQIEAVKAQKDENVSARHSMSIMREGLQNAHLSLHALQQQLSTNQIGPDVVFDRIREFGHDILELAKAGPASAADGKPDALGAVAPGQPGSNPLPSPSEPVVPTQPTKGGGGKKDDGKK